MSEPKIIFEDSDMLILDKPPGWVVNDAVTAHGNPIIQNWLKSKYYYELSNSGEKRSGIVHRLDKETSGILIIGKNNLAFTGIQKQFKERKVVKKYTALVHGRLKDQKGEISAPLARLPWNRERFGVLPSGKEAATYYSLSGLYKDDGGEYYSLLDVTPKTGRTHQIRVHLKFINHPIVSDILYAGRKTARKDRLWCKRMFLHSYAISFTHPRSGERLSFRSELPEDLQSSLKILKK